MIHQLSFDVFLLLRFFSIFIGGLLVYWEAKDVTSNPLTGEEAREDWKKQGIWSDLRGPWRIDRYPASLLFIGYLGQFSILLRPELWAFIGIGLIASAILSPTGYNSLTSILLIAALLRIALLRFTDFAPNKHKFLVGNKTFKLIGENGVLTKGVTPSDQGLVRMEKPIFKNDVMECIADETINVGEEVKVLEVDCGLLKVARVGKNG